MALAALWEAGETAAVPSAQLLACFLSPSLLPPSSFCSIFSLVPLPPLYKDPAPYYIGTPN